MTKRMILKAVPVAAVLTLGACASAGNDVAGEQPGTSTPTIMVENNGWEAVRVYALRNGTEMRIGMVEALGSARFNLRPGMVTPQGYLKVLLRPIAGQEYVLQRVTVNDGNVIHLNVEDMIQLSSLAAFAAR